MNEPNETITRQLVPVTSEDIHIGMVVGGDHSHAGHAVTDVFPAIDGVVLKFATMPDLPVLGPEQLPMDVPLHEALTMIGEQGGVEAVALMASVLLASQEQTAHTLGALQANAERDAKTFALAFTQLYDEVEALNDTLDSRKLGALLSDVSTDYLIAQNSLE